jgi:hypothetical protein
MLLYITAEDVFGGAPAHGAPRPQDGVPATLGALYDQGMRHHARRAVLHSAELGAVPDWKLDRLVIRIALYGREKLGLEPGTRAAVFGRPSWLWPAVESAVQGFAAAAVGIAHDAPDEALLKALREAGPRFVVATDPESAKRLLELHGRAEAPRLPLVAAAGGIPAVDVLALEQLLELGGTLDTAERAQAFRLMCRRIDPQAEALWHVSASGTARLRHAQAVERIGARLRARPPEPGDVVQLLPESVTLDLRLAVAACVGDGRSETVLGHPGTSSEEVARVRPHGLRASASWLEAACRGCEPRWPSALGRRRARRRVQQRLGDRLRFIETDGRVDDATAAAVAAGGIDLIVAEPL